MRILSLVLLLALASLTGCAWMGETAGYIQAKAEEGNAAMRKGYDEGYQNEKRNQANKPYTPPAEQKPVAPFKHATDPKDLRK